MPTGVLTDLAGNPRFVDDPLTIDTGIGDPPIVDIGAFEFQGDACPADLDDDDVVGFADLLVLLDGYNTADGDLNGDGVVTFVDLLILLDAWGPCS